MDPTTGSRDSSGTLVFVVILVEIFAAGKYNPSFSAGFSCQGTIETIQGGEQGNVLVPGKLCVSQVVRGLFPGPGFEPALRYFTPENMHLYQGTPHSGVPPNKPFTVPDGPLFRKNDSVSPENSRVFWKNVSFHAGT